MAWLTAEALRDAAGAKQAGDQDRLVAAAAIASGKARELCGPVTPVESITDRVRVRRPVEEVSLTFRPASLTSIVRTRGGGALDVADFDTDGQVLYRVDGDLIDEDLTVTYSAGYDTLDDVPAEVVSLALMIGVQYLRVRRRNLLDADRVEDLTRTHFLVPAAALAVAEEYLLAPEGGA